MMMFFSYVHVFAVKSRKIHGLKISTPSVVSAEFIKAAPSGPCSGVVK